MRKCINRILFESANAPSGGNSQPWYFKVHGNEISVYAEPEKDNRILNYRNRGTWVAHGALLENIGIVSRHYGYSCSFNEFPDMARKPTLIAKITLKKKTVNNEDEKLYGSIQNRTTNRKTYKRELLRAQDGDAMRSAVTKVGEAEYKLIEDIDEFSSIGRALAESDRVVLENRELHDLFFDEVVWTKTEEGIKQSGLYIKTLELTPPQAFMFKILRYWPIAKILGSFGMAKAIAKSNADIYSSASAMGAILVADEDKNFLDVGRLLQRLWLTATHLNISFHVFAGTSFLQQGVRSDTLTNILKPKHIEAVRRAYEQLDKSFNKNGKIIALLFRLGYSESPSELSTKKEPRILFHD